MVHRLKWLGYDFLIAFAHLLNFRASVSLWLIFFNTGESIIEMDTYLIKQVFGDVFNLFLRNCWYLWRIFFSENFH